MSARRWVTAAVGAALLGGCGPSKGAAVQLTMWLVGSEAQARTINTLAEPFNQRSGIRVKCEAISWGEAHSKYLTAMAGGVEPDIGTMGLTWGLEFGGLGALLDLKREFPEDVAAIERQTFPGLWESVQRDGAVFGIPFDVSLQVLYHRTDLIPQPPQSWEELAALLERIRKDGRRMIIDWGSLSWIGYAPFLWQAGGDLYNAEKTAPALDSPQAIEALAFFRDLYNRYDVPKTSIPIEQGMRTGEFPLVLSGNWKIISLTIGVPELAGKWGIAMLPRGPGGKRTAFLGGRIMGVFARSKHRAEAWRFIQYLFEPEVQRKLYEAGLETQDAYLPPNLASWDFLPLEASMKSVLKQQAQEAKGPPAVEGWTESTHVLEEAIQRVILKEADPGTELGAAAKAISAQMAGAGGGTGPVR
jgi:ABC-type glycerol-3-phosphate transport system substrate-binding protein